MLKIILSLIATCAAPLSALGALASSESTGADKAWREVLRASELPNQPFSWHFKDPTAEDWAKFFTNV